jgi:mRNA interferase MazF
VRRGEIRWYRFARPDKKRPVLVLTRNSIIDHLGEITVAPVTSIVREIPSEVRLGDDDGMPRPCAVNCDHLQTVAKAKLGGGLLTTLSSSRLQEISRAISFSLDL